MINSFILITKLLIKKYILAGQKGLSTLLPNWELWGRILAICMVHELYGRGGGTGDLQESSVSLMLTAYGRAERIDTDFIIN